MTASSSWSTCTSSRAAFRTGRACPRRWSIAAAVAVGLLVLLLEARGELLQRRLPGNRQLVRLAEVAQLGKTLQLDAAASVTLALERTARFALEALPQRLRLR